nr:23S rRNA (uracil(1939)-C(5))-methyltransferase RlmD [Lachnospiraceae bacterium]
MKTVRKAGNPTAKKGCPYMKKCGGCQYIDIPYEKQLQQKQAEMKKLLGKYGKVEPIIGMEEPKHYRHKVHAVFGYEKGGPVSGIYEEKSHRIVKIDRCMIEHEKADEIILSVRNLLKSFKIRTYDEKTDMGLLKHVVVRVSKMTGQIMVILVLRSPILPSKNNFAKALTKLHPEISTIVINVNEKRTTMVLGKRDIVLYGKGYIEDSLCGVQFRLSPQSFYQVNPVQTEILYAKAMEMARLTGKETVIDAYCGIGTIALVAAGKAAKVVGVELNKEAVRDAKENAKRNRASNAFFVCQDAGKWMVEMAQRGESADVVFMDPPRSGSDEAFLSSVCKLAPSRIVYISCGPDTLARDLEYLTKNGYRVEKIQPVDMFPMTAHCEVVVGLKKTGC